MQFIGSPWIEISNFDGSLKPAIDEGTTRKVRKQATRGRF